MCYGDFCDVFRCRGYLKNRRRRKKPNKRNSFTQIIGSHEVLYDLGINIHDEEDFADDPLDHEKEQSNALMTTPPQKVLRVVDENDSNSFVVGLDSGSRTHQDPYGFVINPDKKDHWHGKRPRGGFSQKLKSKMDSHKRSLSEELDDIVSKTASLIERQLGRKLKIFNYLNDSGFADDQVGQEEEECDLDSMQATQDKCTVHTAIFCKGPITQNSLVL